MLSSWDILIISTISIDNRISEQTVEMICRYVDGETIDISEQNIFDLTYLSELLGFDQLKRICVQYIIDCNDRSLIIKKMLFNIDFGISTSDEEAAVSREIEFFVSTDAFYLLPIEVIHRIIFNSPITTSSIMQFAHKIKDSGINFDRFANIYELLEYEEMSDEDLQFLISESENSSEAQRYGSKIIIKYLKETIEQKEELIEEKESIILSLQNANIVLEENIRIDRNEILQVGDYVVILDISANDPMSEENAVFDYVKIKEINPNGNYPYLIGNDSEDYGWYRACNIRLR